MAIELGVFGADGRMGRRIIDALPHFADLTLRCAIDRDTAAEQTFAGCDVVVDFSVAAATADLLSRLAGTTAALVTGTTGRDAAALAAVEAWSAHAPVFTAANFSLGVAVLTDLVERAARALGPAFAPEILEIHHQRKVDAPSGTALHLGEAVARGRALPWPASRALAREGHTGQRPQDEIGFAALRGGDVVGEHTVYYLGAVERLELTHRASDRSVFAHGALRAAQWVHTRAPGRYDMTHLVNDI
jgi:4-hydroxy-tetrahydrodipicolinate reductase